MLIAFQMNFRPKPKKMFSKNTKPALVDMAFMIVAAAPIIFLYFTGNCLGHDASSFEMKFLGRGILVTGSRKI